MTDLFRNNMAVSLATRRWLVGLVTSGVLNDECHLALALALKKCNPIHPGGCIRDLAIDLGATVELATEVGSITEVFYVACSFSDDVQDGDAPTYLQLPQPQIINAMLQLVCLVSLRIEQSCLGRELVRDVVTDFYRTGVMMLTGQEIEMRRDHWNAKAYTTVAELSAGEQMAAYFRLASRAVQSSTISASWSAFGKAMGCGLQLANDLLQRDERFIGLPEDEQEMLRKHFREELAAAAAPLGVLGYKYAEDLLGRL